MASRITTNVIVTETRRAYIALEHPGRGLTVDDCRAVAVAAAELDVPGDTMIRNDISYGEGSYRGGLSFETKINVTDAPTPEVED